MSELLELGTDRRKMILTVYGKDLAAVVREPETRELITVENKIARLKGSKRAALVKQVGLGHLISIEGMGVRNEQGKLVELVTVPDQPGYDKEWKRRLARESVGMKVAALIVSELYTVGGKKSGDEDEELDDLGLEDETDTGEASAASSGERGKKRN